MSPVAILSCIAAYFCFLLGIAWWTSRNANNDSYFLGNKASPWIAVAFGLIGDSLSGVTFISVPGQVAAAKFSYLQIVLGYVLGYVVIAQVLLPLYYRLNLTSIYSYLRGRFGANSQKTGSLFFLLSRTTGAAARLFLTASVIQMFVFDAWGVPFWLSVTGIIALILLYTYKGGIKTLVWTDTFQSSFLLLGVVLSIIAIGRELDLGLGGMVDAVRNSPHSQVFFWDWREKTYFWKQFLSGAFIAIVMTGLDQNMMQKNLSCRSLGEAQKNIYAFTGVMVLVNVFFLSLGALLFHYAFHRELVVVGTGEAMFAFDHVQGFCSRLKTDNLFPLLALQHLGTFAAMAFVIGLTAATFSSADSVLTTLTTSFCIDVLDMDAMKLSEADKTRLRHRIHIAFAVILLLVILAFRALNSDAIINAIFKLAGYTYGPLLGLFAFGLFTRRAVNDRLAPVCCLAAPLLCFVLETNSAAWFGGYKFGFELLMLNGLLTAAGLLLISRADGTDTGQRAA
jgi:SSS family transporter